MARLGQHKVVAEVQPFHLSDDMRWMEQRIACERDPYLRQRVPRERIVTFWAGIDGGAALAEALAAFRGRLRDLHVSESPVAVRRPEAVGHEG